MSKIIFIEPKAPSLHIFSKFMLPRLGIYILATMAKQRGWDVEVIYEEMHKIDFSRIETADIVGISTITITAPRAYLIADKVREVGIPVIMGGPHVSFKTEEALEHADFVVRGEGEKALMAFLDAREDKLDYGNVPNLSYIKDNKVIHNPKVYNNSDLDHIPFPELLQFNYEPERFGGFRLIPMETSRGCPFDCTFCSVTSMFGRNYRFRSTKKIIQELRRYNDEKTVIFFYDDNFTANPKHSKELLREMIKENFKFKWTTQVRADVVKDLELVKLMQEARCYNLYIGFESVNPKSLEEMKKKQTVEEMTHAIKVLREHDIHIHGMFVFGFDEDDLNTAKETIKFAKKTGLASIQFVLLTPLPGSEFYDEMVKQGRIRIDDWALFDAHHAVFEPAKLSPAQLQKAQLYGYKKFYSRFGMLNKFLHREWFELSIAHYARNLIRMWQKDNKTYLKTISRAG